MKEIPTTKYYKQMYKKQIELFTANLHGTFPLKTTEDSKDIYDNYNNKDIQNYNYNNRTCLYNNTLQKLSFKEIRKLYLEYIFSEIETLNPNNILEVGCGNCINLMLLNQKYPNINISGLDISRNRLETACNYYNLTGIKLHPLSITERTPFTDNHFNFIFTMHCLEQIPYNCQKALEELYRIANKTIVLIEPVFELANPTQRIYIINNDHNRILLRTIHHLKYNITKLEPLTIQSNPLNQSSIIVIMKGNTNA